MSPDGRAAIAKCRSAPLKERISGVRVSPGYSLFLLPSRRDQAALWISRYSAYGDAPLYASRHLRMATGCWEPIVRRARNRYGPPHGPPPPAPSHPHTRAHTHTHTHTHIYNRAGMRANPNRKYGMSNSRRHLKRRCAQRRNGLPSGPNPKRVSVALGADGRGARCEFDCASHLL